MGFASPLRAAADSSPFGSSLDVAGSGGSSATAHGLGFSGAAVAGSDLATDLEINLYDAKGNAVGAGGFASGPKLAPDALPAGWSEIDVALSGSEVSVKLGPQGQIEATQTSAAGVVTYDSTAGADPNASLATLAAQQKLATLAGQLATLAGSTSGTSLTKAATLVESGIGSLFDPAADPAGSDIVVTVTTGANVSLFQVGTDGTVIGERTGGTIALEKVAVNGTTVVDSLRRTDGSGYTKDGILTVAFSADGAETVTVDPSELLADTPSASSSPPKTSDDASILPASATTGPTSPLQFSDAFGDDVRVSADGEITVTSHAGTTVDYQQSSTFSTWKDQSDPHTTDSRLLGFGSVDVTAKIGGSAPAERARIASGATLDQIARTAATVDVSAVNGQASTVSVDEQSHYSANLKENQGAIQFDFDTSLETAVTITGRVAVNALSSGTSDEGTPQVVKSKGSAPIVSGSSAAPDKLSDVQVTGSSKYVYDKHTEAITPEEETQRTAIRFLGETLSF
jgi:hypothetical protein